MSSNLFFSVFKGGEEALYLRGKSIFYHGKRKDLRKQINRIYSFKSYLNPARLWKQSSLLKTNYLISWKSKITMLTHIAKTDLVAARTVLNPKVLFIFLSLLYSYPKATEKGTENKQMNKRYSSAYLDKLAKHTHGYIFISAPSFSHTVPLKQSLRVSPATPTGSISPL